MNKAKGLGLFVLLAFLGTACGKTSSEPPKPDVLPQQVVQAPAVDDKQQEVEPKSQEKSTEAGENKPANDANAGAKSGTGDQAAAGSKSGNTGASTAPANNGSSTGGTKANGSGTPSAGGSSAPANGSGGTANSANAGKFDLSVTEYFGSNSVYAESLAFSKEQSLLDVMRDHLDVETAYGGSFVNAINGTKSGYTSKSIFTRKKRDWFYYVNGSIAPVGADSVKLAAGDSVWWDYHDWAGDGSSTPNVVASYPHPFTTGYNGVQPGTTIYYSGNHATDANRLAEALRGVGASGVSTATYDNSQVEHPARNVIVLGTWKELQGQSALQNLFGAPTRTGLYAKFGEGDVQMLNYQGKPTGRTGQSAILATGTGSGTNPVWLVIGSTDAGLDQAVDTMVTNPRKLQGKVGVVLSGGEAVGVPVAE